MTLRDIGLLLVAAGALGACDGPELEPADGTGTPIPPPTRIGSENVEPRPRGGIVDQGQVPDDRDGVPNAQDTSRVQP